MQTLETLKTRSQESIANLIERGKQQPDEVKTWGMTAAAGVAGALTITAVAKGLLAVVATLANPPVALTVGALGGGALGWSLMQKQAQAADLQAETTIGMDLPQTGTEQVASVADTPEAATAEPSIEFRDVGQ